jgi:hypothetical protein
MHLFWIIGREIPRDNKKLSLTYEIGLNLKLDLFEVAFDLIKCGKLSMNKTLLVFILLLVVSCQTNEKPKGILTQAQLSAFFVDVYLAEARVDAVPQVKDSTIRYFLPMEEKLLKKNGISDSTLKITYAYYVAHPKELEQIYDAVIDTLALREKRLSHVPMTPRKKANMKN